MAVARIASGFVGVVERQQVDCAFCMAGDDARRGATPEMKWTVMHNISSATIFCFVFLRELIKLPIFSSCNGQSPVCIQVVRSQTCLGRGMEGCIELAGHRRFIFYNHIILLFFSTLLVLLPMLSRNTLNTQAAKVLSKRFETRFAKLNAPPKPPGSTAGVKRAREGGSTRANGGKRPKATDIPPADDDRRRLAQQLGCARMEDLTAAVHEIDSQCPNALVRNGDAIDVDIDALDTWTFSAVERIVSPLAHLRRISRGKDRRARKKTRLAGGASGGKGGVGGGRSGAGGGAAEGGSTSTGRGGRPYKKTRAETSPS